MLVFLLVLLDELAVMLFFVWTHLCGWLLSCRLHAVVLCRKCLELAHHTSKVILVEI
jgi:hypothetical protein